MLNIGGIISIILFYLLILAVGIWAGRKKEEGNDSEEEVMLAGRNIGLFVGIFTMTGKNNTNKLSFVEFIYDDTSPSLNNANKFQTTIMVIGIVIKIIP